MMKLPMRRLLVRVQTILILSFLTMLLYYFHEAYRARVWDTGEPQRLGNDPSSAVVVDDWAGFDPQNPREWEQKESMWKLKFQEEAKALQG